MVETFLNDGKKLDSNLVVDHIDTDKLNNSIDNLRIVTQSENMKNELTLLSLSKPIKFEFNKRTVYFKSILNCSKIIGVSSSTVRRWIKQKNTTLPQFSNFQYVTEDEKDSSNIKYIETKDDLKSIK